MSKNKVGWIIARMKPGQEAYPRDWRQVINDLRCGRGSSTIKEAWVKWAKDNPRATPRYFRAYTLENTATGGMKVKMVDSK